MNRQKLTLCILLLVLAGSAGYSYLKSPRQERVAVLKYRPGAVALAPAASNADLPKAARKQSAPPSAPLLASVDDTRVHIELLDRESSRFSGFRRNIFSPIFREEVKLPPFKPLPPPPKPVVMLPKPPAAGPPPPSAPLPPPSQSTGEDAAAGELAKFTFLGFLKKGGDRTVFLSENNEIFLAKKGSVLLSKFRVSDLTDEAITIKTIAGGRELVIPLLENKAKYSTHGN